MTTDPHFWTVLDTLVREAEVVIERPAGTPQPRFPGSLYPLDYGALRHTRSGDGADIDVFRGTSGRHDVTGVVATVDARKRDAELKVLLGCTAQEAEAVRAFLSWPGSFGCLVLPRGTQFVQGGQ
ncbi:inorganic pyrophosphatase [Deinococcus ficus]|uniref:inorganic pyrophosphatase n=1 Tax=Deinococcus ficus TaxID=317577 RepID=UPI0003B58C5A|nr:inorganic pyrophosphatase [Deinococcus ficus]